ncbi:arginyltransferase [Tepidamorphus sp. 3E244]|uniref:arginyltransferase n=1 Tax=Tepidamorphus sp. 3E244 TaxID=3385498 RepID=UPI0038FC6F95
MSRISPGAPQFYLTAPTPCPYLPGRYERKVFTQLAGERAPELNDILTQGGFRRSQSIAYRPACEGCRACVSVRIRVDEFEPTRSHKRLLKKNRDIIGEDRAPISDAEQYALFRDYLLSRHDGGGMADMSVLDYGMMVEDSPVTSRLIAYRGRGPDSAITGLGQGALYACALTDELHDGLSMVYSFFDTDLAARSLGTFMILDHIERARKRGLPFVYLGYWVRDSDKMGYKIGFRPQEHLLPGGWREVDAEGDPLEPLPEFETHSAFC